MDNKQFPERDEEEIIPEELTFFPADEESEDAGDVPVSEDVIGKEPASQPEEIPAAIQEVAKASESNTARIMAEVIAGAMKDTIDKYCTPPVSSTL